jgi:glycosyltransferase involved in cell wall biosynthesis
MLPTSSQPAGPVRVLHVITPSRMAGAETFLARLLNRTRGGHVDHYCALRSSGADTQLEAAGLTFESLGIGGKANPLALPRLHRAARRRQADLLHSHLSTASWWCGWYEQFGGPPSIGHVHGFTSATWHRRQSHLIACSDAVRRHLLREGIADQRITVLHYPVDPDDMRPQRSPADVRAEFGAAPDTPVVGTFAHLSLKKGYRELVQAAALVLRRMPTAQFWCFGEGPLHTELEQSARTLGIADRFKLFGFRRDVPDLMRAIDVMCLPSHREPFGLVYVEAALADKPVIGCHAGGAPEIIAHGETGLLVPPPKAVSSGQGAGRSVQIPAACFPIADASIEPLSEAILTLLDNPSQAAAMGRRGRELALERFGWPEYVTRLNEIYDRTLSRDTISLTCARPQYGPTAIVARAWRPQLAFALGMVIMLLAAFWGRLNDDQLLLSEISVQTGIQYEVYTDRAAFERRLRGAVRWVDFEDLGTGSVQFAAFEPTRYAARGIIIRGASEQCVARPSPAPADIQAVSQPKLDSPTPLPVYSRDHATNIEFINRHQPALVCGFGLDLIDLDARDQEHINIAIFDRDGRMLFEDERAFSADAPTTFRGILALDAAGNAAPVIAQVRLINHASSLGADTTDLALDNFVYTEPRPYRR